MSRPTGVPNLPLFALLDKGDWLDRVACRKEDAYLFGQTALPDETKPEWQARLAFAVGICQDCPVRYECLRDALANGDRGEIRGGMALPVASELNRPVPVEMLRWRPHLPPRTEEEAEIEEPPEVMEEVA